MKQHILIVEDEAAIREMVASTLEFSEFEVTQAADCAAADRAIGDRLPDLLLLDWMLPGQSGLEFARRLRREEVTADLPIIMLTARGEEHERLSGFDAGIDDYVSKPFSPRELVARIRAVLRRTSGLGREPVLKVGDLKLDAGSHRATVGDREIKLGPTEFRLLKYFMGHPDRAYTRAQLLDRVWGSNVYVEERTVDVHVRRLRKALSPSAHDKCIETVHGTGYRFVDNT